MKVCSGPSCNGQYLLGYEETYLTIENETTIIWTIKGHIETQSTPAWLTRNRYWSNPQNLLVKCLEIVYISAKVNITVIDVGEFVREDSGYTAFRRGQRLRGSHGLNQQHGHHII